MSSTTLKPTVGARGAEFSLESAMNSSVDKPTGEPSMPKSRASIARWWLATALGAIVILPFGWLLSHAALLPFYLGVFFFALFGLVIGAGMHRIAAASRPLSSAILLLGTTIVVLVGWTFSLYMESRDMPRKMAAESVNQVRNIGDRTVADYRREITQGVRAYLRERYPPGGTIGYVRWVLARGEIAPGALDSISVKLLARQRGWWWLVRAVLSVGLLAFGVASQTFLLKLDKDPAVRAMDKTTH